MLRRRNTPTPDDLEAPATVTVDTPDGPTGKGRPTPKRRDVERSNRTPIVAPRTAKEARSASRARMRDERAGRMRGEEQFLPIRDRGPVRKFVRDYVDARRNTGGIFMPGAFLVLALTWTRNPLIGSVGFLLMLALIFAIVIDSFLLTRAIKRQVAERFPDEAARGLGSYAVMRALQIRRLRIPPPRVKRGDHV